jgi:AraC-like DNA-binding protein
MELIASAASARQILAHMDGLGVDVRTLNVGYVDPALQRSSAPVQVSARLSFDLLEAAARHLHQPDFGLRHGLWLNLRGLDSISLLWDHAGSVAEWYSLARKYVHLENNAVGYEVVHEGEDVALVHDVLAVLRPGATQGTFAFVTMSARVFREMVGPAWTPVRVEFMGPRPADTTLFRSFYRCRVEFDAPRNALVVKRSDFEQPLPRHNPELVTFFEQQLRRQVATHSTQPEDLVTGLFMSNMAGSPPSLDAVAGQLGMTGRTLQRRLRSKQTSYGRLLAKARDDIAAAHLRRTPPTPLSRLAYELGFSDATAASRFLRNSRANAVSSEETGE